MTDNPILMIAQSPTIDTYGIVLLIIGGVVAISGLVALWWISKKVPKGVTLAIAIGIYIFGSVVGHIMVREVQLVSGTFKFMGFVGIIMGIIDLFRKRKPVAGGDVSGSGSGSVSPEKAEDQKQ